MLVDCGGIHRGGVLGLTCWRRPRNPRAHPAPQCTAPELRSTESAARTRKAQRRATGEEGTEGSRGITCNLQAWSDRRRCERHFDGRGPIRLIGTTTTFGAGA